MVAAVEKIDALPVADDFTYNDRPAFYEAEYDLFVLSDLEKTMVPQAYRKKI